MLDNNSPTLAGHSNNGQESWGRDSGARDLSPDLHRPHSSGTGSQMTENEAGMDQVRMREGYRSAGAFLSINTHPHGMYNIVNSSSSQRDREREEREKLLRTSNTE